MSTISWWTRGGWLVTTCVAVAMSAPVVSLSAAQTGAETDLKAAFLFNFARFAVWPVDAVPAGGALTFCVLGDSFVAQALEKMVLGKTIDGHALIVTRVKRDGALRGCQILYAGRVDRVHALELLSAVDGAAILTVSDFNTFTQIGGTLELFVEANRVRFSVNVESAHKSRVQLSAQLLRLAKLVIADDSNAVSR
jgi:hypothetical protein